MWQIASALKYCEFYGKEFRFLNPLFKKFKSFLRCLLSHSTFLKNWKGSTLKCLPKNQKFEGASFLNLLFEKFKKAFEAFAFPLYILKTELKIFLFWKIPLAFSAHILKKFQIFFFTCSPLFCTLKTFSKNYFYVIFTGKNIFSGLRVKMCYFDHSFFISMYNVSLIISNIKKEKKLIAIK